MNKLLSSLTLLLVLGGTAHASTPPRVLTEEGRLAGADGTPSTGAATLTFAVYDAPTGGTALWSETQTVTLGAGGYFAAQLGLGLPLPAEAFDGPTRYLGIRVDGEAEMTPRQVVSSVPYALLAGDVSGDIHPTSIAVNGQTIVDAQGNWVEPTTGLQGPQGPQGRVIPKQRNVYSITARLPIEADGRPRYRIRSETEKVERVVTEEQISQLG